ncbi:ATP-binding cassette domain-containing protein [Thiohalobacter thiocyanaticus]|uniref:ATP-binding protein Uup n=1 Tax=Thiohalobacter thiocyanaticus TaxID=585455 RepID=A0A426QIB4_9GAMM|nr:ATP-binding cassette domain-containing protein [Thiohalobacter thiocyanaticus]RRQ21504.1 ATP-binding cassette domain-containing protein [Thiohalobacter thiocyanaticus]
MPLLSFRDVTLQYGDPPLLDGVSFQIEPGERLCLIGRNGTGKSTLLRLVAGELAPDDGLIQRADGLRIAQLAQEVPRGAAGSVYHVVAEGLGEVGRLVEQYHTLTHAIAAGDLSRMDELEQCQHALEGAGGWEINQRVDTVLSKLELDAEAQIEQLSGGLKRRVLLARALVSQPDLLLLDEPTNHLDIDAITWLEEFLLGWQGALLFITHDRAFLRRLATRIIELDRGHLTDFPGDYDTYLRRKAELLAEEERHNALFDRKLAQEEAWIRQGIKARRTRNEGRVRALQQLRRERAERRERTGPARISVQSGERSGKLVVEAEDAGFDYDGEPVIRGLTTTILRGDKVGIIGPNGAGKTTLLRLLLGELEPTAGRIRRGTNLEVAYFDQYRAALEEDKTVLDNVGQGRDRLTINGQDRHVISYLQDFLFAPARARQPVSALSGGERNRLLLAKLFTRPANVLVLDEPTNDLDTDTLELLEELLIEYTGTVLLVSHDRAFLDNIVTSSLVFEGGGRVNEYVGGYADWLRQREQAQNRSPASAPAAARAAAGAAATAPRPARTAKLSYKDQRELEQLPQRIEQLENEQARLSEALGRPELYQQDKAGIGRARAQLKAVESELEQAYARWEELEARN